MEFPKIIHQIWLQGENNIPSKHFKNIKSIKEFNPQHKYILWDEISILEIIHKNKTWTKTYYSLIYLHQKVDYARYIILYLFGGLYIDIDVKAIKSFDDLLEKHKKYDLIVSCLNINEFNSILQCQHQKCINNGVIISKPNVEVLKNMIEFVDIDNKCTDVTPKTICINTTTGPLAFTTIIMKYIKSNKNNKILLLQPEYLEPCTLGICNSTKNTIIEHKHDGSWVPEWQYNLIKFYLEYTISTIIITLLVLCIICYVLYTKYKS